MLILSQPPQILHFSLFFLWIHDTIWHHFMSTCDSSGDFSRACLLPVDSVRMCILASFLSCPQLGRIVSLASFYGIFFPLTALNVFSSWLLASIGSPGNQNPSRYVLLGVS